MDYKHAGTEGRVSGPAPDHKGYGSFASFSGPDGNGSLLQEITPRPSWSLTRAGPGKCRTGASLAEEEYPHADDL